MRSGENTTHLDTDALAEFRAGLITGRRGARIATHLAGCERCTALDDRLAGVSALLASVPAPAMPDRVARRLDTVLAAEVAKRDYPERSRRDSPRETATHDWPTGHRGFRLMSLRVLAPAAAVVLAAAGYGLSQLSHGPGSMEAASPAGRAASASSSSPPGSAARATGRANAPVAEPPSPAPSPARRNLSPATVPVVISHAGLSSLAALKQQVQAELSVPPKSRAAQAASPLVSACVRQVADGAQPLLVESVPYKGQPSLVVVTPAGRHDTVWVAGPGCSGAKRDVVASAALP
ncbi:MAG: hypothetical protein ACRDOH_09760 [Streptosporangiaceae bacterium]